MLLMFIAEVIGSAIAWPLRKIGVIADKHAVTPLTKVSSGPFVFLGMQVARFRENALAEHMKVDPLTARKLVGKSLATSVFLLMVAALCLIGGVIAKSHDQLLASQILYALVFFSGCWGIFGMLMDLFPPKKKPLP